MWGLLALLLTSLQVLALLALWLRLGIRGTGILLFQLLGNYALKFFNKSGLKLVSESDQADTTATLINDHLCIHYIHDDESYVTFTPYNESTKDAEVDHVYKMGNKTISIQPGVGLTPAMCQKLGITVYHSLTRQIIFAPTE